MVGKTNMKLNCDNTYTKWYSEDEDETYYFSVSELITIGPPIDENGVDMEQVDEYMYAISDGEYKIVQVEKNF
jgi:hypothetical protein